MSFKHKHKASDAGDLAASLVPRSPEETVTSTTLTSPRAESTTIPIMRRGFSGDLDETFRTGYAHSSESSPPSVSGIEHWPEAEFNMMGRQVKATVSRKGVELFATQERCLPRFGPSNLGTLHFEDILSADTEASSGCGICSTEVEHVLVINTLRKRASNKNIWTPYSLKLSSKDYKLVQEWAARLNVEVKLEVDRPHKLLVIINPYGGAKQALRVWENTVRPIFQNAGITSEVVVTQREGHAKDVILELTMQRIEEFDGVVAVGGDGLFQEIINGVLAVRSLGTEAGATLKNWRIGHIPAGSTDAVAYSINGTRSAPTAALHIALGDRTPIDVMRVDTEDGQHRFSVCVASYGYMGDLMRQSEKLRWIGPFRYDLAGAYTLLRGAAYNARIEYRTVTDTRFKSSKTVCRSQCQICLGGSGAKAPSQDAFTIPASDARRHGEWKAIEGQFKGIMVVVSPCRSDRSTLGLLPFCHLNDGRLHLILIRDCTRPQYLKFLASIPGTGVEMNKFPYVDVIDCTAVQVIPSGPESSWSVDGELLHNNSLSGEVHRGLLDVFARGLVV